ARYAANGAAHFIVGETISRRKIYPFISGYGVQCFRFRFIPENIYFFYEFEQFLPYKKYSFVCSILNYKIVGKCRDFESEFQWISKLGHAACVRFMGTFKNLNLCVVLSDLESSFTACKLRF